MRQRAVLVALIIVLAGCGSYQDARGKGDAPIANRTGDDKAAVVINFPDGFANVALKCYRGNGIYSTTREATVVIVRDDPLCDGDEVKPLVTGTRPG